MMGLTEVLARVWHPQSGLMRLLQVIQLRVPNKQRMVSESHSQSPLGSGLTPKQVADAVLFLINAKSVTGQIIFVDSERDSQ